MVAMAVEASVAQLLRTGFVHVDPHEGNMIFTDDDELCFIDFGLMARVDPINMEAFASGVCHMLAGKYYELTYGEGCEYVSPIRTRAAQPGDRSKLWLWPAL
eukprot:scaffold209083_cov27-Prasinocladus_malaysianus.AAC.1